MVRSWCVSLYHVSLSSMCIPLPCVSVYSLFSLSLYHVSPSTMYLHLLSLLSLSLSLPCVSLYHVSPSTMCLPLTSAPLCPPPPLSYFLPSSSSLMLWRFLPHTSSRLPSNPPPSFHHPPFVYLLSFFLTFFSLQYDPPFACVLFVLWVSICKFVLSVLWVTLRACVVGATWCLCCR
jgi:hypothetical protein